VCVRPAVGYGPHVSIRWRISLPLLRKSTSVSFPWCHLWCIGQQSTLYVHTYSRWCVYLAPPLYQGTKLLAGPWDLSGGFSPSSEARDVPSLAGSSPTPSLDSTSVPDSVPFPNLPSCSAASRCLILLAAQHASRLSVLRRRNHPQLLQTGLRLPTRTVMLPFRRPSDLLRKRIWALRRSPGHLGSP